MAKSKNNSQDLLQQLSELLNKPADSAAPPKQSNKKAITALKQAQTALERAIALLSGNANEEDGISSQQAVEVDPEAPFGRKKDGTPKRRPGRTKTAE